MSELKINGFAKEVGQDNTVYGFRNSGLKCTDFVSLIHPEMSEIPEEFRDGHEATEIYHRKDDKLEGASAELADAVIRCLDMAGFYGTDLESTITEKHRFNKARPYKYDKQF